MRIELFEKCLMPGLTYGLAAWGSITDKEIQQFEQIQGESLKIILQPPTSTSFGGIIMETGVWPLKERLEYSTVMLFHEMMNSDDTRKAREVIEEQEREGIIL